jgi:hypothetical protein
VYNYIVKIKHIEIILDRNTFNKIFNQKLKEINLEKTKEWKQKLSEKNEFIRFKFNNSYMDLTIKEITLKINYVIYLGDVIDFNKPDFYKNNKESKRNFKTGKTIEKNKNERLRIQKILQNKPIR